MRPAAAHRSPAAGYPAGHSSELARALSQVCGSWRRGLAEERAALARLRFTRLEHTAGSGAAAPVQLPWLVHQAVKAGNVAATVAAARWLDRQPGRPQRPVCPRTAAATAYAAGTWYRGCEAAVAAVASASATAVPRGGDADAARYWSRGAKMGHPEAQWRLGFAHYKGLMGLAHDGEEAHLWLSRAARQLCELLGVSLDQPSAAAGAEGSTRALPALLSAADCRAILAQVRNLGAATCAAAPCPNTPATTHSLGIHSSCHPATAPLAGRPHSRVPLSRRRGHARGRGRCTALVPPG